MIEWDFLDHNGSSDKWSLSGKCKRVVRPITVVKRCASAMVPKLNPSSIVVYTYTFLGEYFLPFFFFYHDGLIDE